MDGTSRSVGMEELTKVGNDPVDCVVEEELTMRLKNTYHRRLKSEADPFGAFYKYFPIFCFPVVRFCVR